jgi:hypothetical protein
MSISAGALGLMQGWENEVRNFDGLTIACPKAFVDRSTLVLRSSDAMGGFRLNLVITRARSLEPVEAFAQSIYDSILADPPTCLELSLPVPTQLANASGMALEMSHDQSLEDGGETFRVKRRHVIAARNGTTYHLIATHVSEWFEANRGQIEAMISSVQLPD